MAVRVLRDTVVYWSASCQMVSLHAGQEIGGDFGVFLESTLPDGVEVIAPPVESKPVEPTIKKTAGGGESKDEAPPAPAPSDSVEDPESEPEGHTPAAEALDAYDPSQHTAAQVVAWVKDHPDQTDAVIAAERAGKSRTTLLTALS